MKLLLASSEVYPLAKTGGLADVAGALPAALQRAGVDVRVLLPAYRGLAARLNAGPIASLGDPFGVGEARILEGRLPDSAVIVWLLDCPALYDRDGSLYLDGQGRDWADNDLRFGLLSWAAARLSQPSSPLGWVPDVLHGHDWQTGLAPAYLAAWGGPRPATVFTIHNMAFQGCFSAQTLPRLGLPWSLFTMDACEYYGQLSYLKAGLALSDKLTTVSPSYAHEIQTQPNGFGLEGLLSWRARDLVGILNGGDYRIWEPQQDHRLVQRYGRADVTAGKAANKAALQAELGLPQSPDAPLLIVISRLTAQKGIDLLLTILPGLLAQGIQLVVLGNGERAFEDAFVDLARQQPQQVATRIGYDEDLAHRMQAGGDILLMPSRFEPCGLTQMYALRYGTLPVVHCTGGLADTITDTGYDSLLHGTATGFVFSPAVASAFQWSVERALALYRHGDHWRRIQAQAIQTSFSWDDAARRYLALYHDARAQRG